MNESNITLTKQFTGCATLAAIGIQMKELKLFEPIEQTVQIAQKTIKDSPTDKLYDALISLLAGAHGLVEINTRLRADGAFKLTNPLVSPLADSYTESMIVDPAQDLRRPGTNTCNQRISAAIKAAIWHQAFRGTAR